MFCQPAAVFGFSMSKPGWSLMSFLEKTRKWDWFWGEPLGLWEKLLLFLNFGKNTREDVSEDGTFLGNLDDFGGLDQLF